MRLSGADVVVASCIAHKLTSKIMVSPVIQKVADLRGKVLALANFAMSLNDMQAAQAGFKPPLELGNLNLPYAGNCTSAMRPNSTAHPARMCSFVTGITEATA